jgi:transcriptional regulator with XRE-family HTH domain
MTVLEADSPQEKQLAIAARMRARRLALNLRLGTLSERSAVPVSTIRRFERTGEVSLAALCRLALALGSYEDLDGIFSEKAILSIADLDAHEEAKKHQRRRGRR